MPVAVLGWGQEAASRRAGNQASGALPWPTTIDRRGSAHAGVPAGPGLSFWQIWNMSFGFLGIQFGWGLQLANMSAIYTNLGADPDRIPILWLAGPVTG